MNFSPLLLFGTLLVALALVPALGILASWRKVPYRSSLIGRVLHAKSLSIAEVLVLSMVGGVLVILGVGRPWWFEVLRLVAFGHVAVSLWRQWGAYRTILRTRAMTHPSEQHQRRDLPGVP